jgi:hypothetical protein
MGFVMSAMIAQRNTETLARFRTDRQHLHQESAAESGITLKFCQTASSGTILGFDLSWSPDHRLMVSVPLALRMRLSSAIDDLGDADSAEKPVCVQIR